MRTWGLSLLVLLTAVNVAAADGDLGELLTPIRKEYSLPALGAAVIVDGELKAVQAIGLRKFDGKQNATAEDKWHIGSCTKSMTATLAATFVEAGKLRWDSTLGEVLGETVPMRDEYKKVTLKDLLSNRSGLPGKVPSPIWVKAYLRSGEADIREPRREFVKSMLQIEPVFEPGTDYEYSNTGFTVAGVMLETVADQSWETLMRERLFEPLKMESAGFGMPASKGKDDQPWGHHKPDKPQPPGLQADNPAVIGPAGIVHASLTDLARYVRMHMLKETGPVLKKAETFEVLHTIAEGNDSYACGWAVAQHGWAGGEALTHNGSNTMNYCTIWFAPKRKFATISVTNLGGKDARKACDQLASALIGKYLK